MSYTKEEFLSLYQQLFEGNSTPYRYCVKQQHPVEFAILPDLKCWECEHFVLNGGVCDPL
jgi:hypothetical protein